MARLPKRDYGFDPIGFAELIKRAKGPRTQIEFSADTGLSITHINKYINARWETPPSPAAIRKIARDARDNVTYSDLMRSAGYNPNIYMESESENSIDVEGRTTKGIILSNLMANPDVCLNLRKDETGLFEFKIDMVPSEIPGWHPLFTWLIDFSLLKSESTIDYIMQSRIYSYLQIEIIGKMKISVVTDRRSIFDSLREYRYLNFPICLSSILVNLKEARVEDEFFFETAFHNDNSNLFKSFLAGDYGNQPADE